MHIITTEEKEIWNPNIPDEITNGFRYELDPNIQYDNEGYSYHYKSEVGEYWEFAVRQPNIQFPTWQEYDDYFRNDDGTWTYIVIDTAVLNAEMYDGNKTDDGTRTTGLISGKYAYYNGGQVTALPEGEVWLYIPIQSGKTIPIQNFLKKHIKNYIYEIDDHNQNMIILQHDQVLVF